MSEYKITEEQKNLLLQISAQTLPDSPSRDGYSAEAIRKRLYQPFAALVDLVNGVFGTAYSDVEQIQNALENGDLFTRAMVGWRQEYTYAEGEIVYYPIGTYGAFVMSAVDNNVGNPPYLEGEPDTSRWQELVSFDKLHEYVNEAKGYAQEAEASAQDARDAIDIIGSYLREPVLFLPALPASGDVGVLYAVVNGDNTYLFTLYTWEGDDWSEPRGTASLDPNYSYYKSYPITLAAVDWENNQQEVHVSGLTDNAIVDVFPVNGSAAAYSAAGITVEQDGSTLHFSCATVPMQDLLLTVWRTGYTLTETDAQTSGPSVMASKMYKIGY